MACFCLQGSFSIAVGEGWELPISKDGMEGDTRENYLLLLGWRFHKIVIIETEEQKYDLNKSILYNKT